MSIIQEMHIKELEEKLKNSIPISKIEELKAEWVEEDSTKPLAEYYAHYFVSDLQTLIDKAKQDG